jgi:hypothetical protein
MVRRITTAAMVVFAVSACAHAYPPPGGERDTQPPRLLETRPVPLAVVPGFDEPVVFRFDKRLSERGFSEALVIVSPQDGAIRVDRTGREVRVRIDGGWRPDRVYRVVLLPGVRDLFGNTRDEQAEIVFSTGPAVPATAIAGIVIDRITGRPPQTAAVNAVDREDGTTYLAIADSAGFFSLRHVPVGEYEMRAWADQNRNRRRDPAEPVDSGRVVTLAAPTDTVAIAFGVMPVDTTPPNVVRAAVVDSMRVRVTFDDYFDIDEPVLGATAEVHALPDSVPFAGARRLILAPLYERGRAAAEAAERRAAEAAQAADTAAALRPDTAAAPRPDTAAAPRRADPAAAARPAARPAPRPDEPLLPTREVIVELDRPLLPGLAYTITVAGAVNISGLAGGGVARFEVPAAAPPPDPPPPDAPPANPPPANPPPADPPPADPPPA